MVAHLVVGGLADRPWRPGGCLAVLPVRRDGRRSRHDSAAPTSDRAHRLSAASERCGTRPARTSCTRAAGLAGRRPAPMTEAAPAGARNNAMHPGGDMASGLRGRSSWAMGRASGPGRGVGGKRGSLAKTPCTCTVGLVVHRQVPPDRQVPPANPTGKSHWRGPGRRWARPAAPVEMAEINAEAAQRPHTPRARRTPGARSSARQGRGRRQPLEVLPGWPPRPRDPRRHPLQRETGACRAPVRREAWVSAVDGGRGWFWLGCPRRMGNSGENPIHLNGDARRAVAAACGRASAGGGLAAGSGRVRRQMGGPGDTPCNVRTVGTRRGGGGWRTALRSCARRLSVLSFVRGDPVPHPCGQSLIRPSAPRT
jgi:hypothetical protein